MAIYDNRYYPDEREVTWADLDSIGEYVEAGYVDANYVATGTGLGLTWGDGTRDWHTWTNSNVSWSFVTNTSIDLGSVRSGYPISRAEWDQSQGYGLTISYQTSTDNIAFSNVAAGILTGRYIRTVATTQASWLSRLETQINFDTTQEVFTNVNTAALSGNVNGRVLPVETIGNVEHVSTQSSVGVYSASSYDVDVLAVNTGSMTFVVKDLDTWGKANVDVAGLDFIIQGFPRVSANAALGTVDRIE